ncbi:MAG: serine protease, partial [Halobacteriovoraceae bacterium]|nr:serine protease [Halobacteriovoraceae bacterium]
VKRHFSIKLCLFLLISINNVLEAQDDQLIESAVCAVNAGKWSGSGVIISENGMGVTAAHVVSENNIIAEHIFFNCGRQIFNAKEIAIDYQLDIALVRLEPPSSSKFTHYISLGTSKANLKQRISIMGYPSVEGIENPILPLTTITRGEIRKIHVNGQLETSARIGPGHSGSPILSNNQLLGIIHSASSVSGHSMGTSNIQILKMINRTRINPELWHSISNTITEVEGFPPSVEQPDDSSNSFFEDNIIERPTLLNKLWTNMNALNLENPLLYLLLIFLIFIFWVFSLVKNWMQWIYERFYYGRDAHIAYRQINLINETAHQMGKKLSLPSKNDKGPYHNILEIFEGVIKRLKVKCTELKAKESLLFKDRNQEDFESFYSKKNGWAGYMSIFINVLSLATEFLCTSLFLFVNLRNNISEADAQLYSVIIGLLFILAVLIIKKNQYRFFSGIEWIYWPFFISAITVFVWKVVDARSDGLIIINDKLFIVATILMAALGSLLSDFFIGHPQDTKKYDSLYENRRKHEKIKNKIDRIEALKDRVSQMNKDKKQNFQQWYKEGARSFLSRIKNSPSDISTYCHGIDQRIA